MYHMCHKCTQFTIIYFYSTIVQQYYFSFAKQLITSSELISIFSMQVHSTLKRASDL